MIRLVLLAGAATALAACNPLGSPANNMAMQNQSAAASLPIYRVAITAAGPDNCAITLDGAPVTSPVLLERLVAATREAVDREGGAAHTSERMLPYVHLDAPADMRFSCVGPVLTTIFRSGALDVQLGKGDGSRSVLVESPILDQRLTEQTQLVVTVAGGGRLTINGEPGDLAEVRRLAPDPRDYAEGETERPGGLVVATTAETTVGEAHEVLTILALYSPILLSPGAAVPRGAAPGAPGASQPGRLGPPPIAPPPSIVPR